MNTNKMIPKLLRKNTAEDYLQAAIDTAEWIDTLAIKTEHGRIWKALPDDQDGYREDVPLFTSKSLYDGSAGIGIFLLRLYEATQNERWLLEAEEAAAHIIATEVDESWYDKTLHSEVKGIIPVPGWAAGPYNGPVGEAYFLEDLYQVTGKEEYRAFVLRTADTLIKAAIRDEKGIHWSDQQDITADGGFIVFLDILYRRTGIQKYLDVACEAADYIAKDALDAPNGGKYWKLLDLSIIDFEKDTTFPNFSHGTTGTAWMFAALYQDTGRQEYLELAKAGVEYVMNISVGDETGRLIPYQDHPVKGPTYEQYYLSTCHGPVGSTLVFRELYDITEEEKYKQWAVELSRGIVKAGAPEKHSWGFWNCQCQCCGTAGILEHFADMYEYTKDTEFYQYMLRTADVLLSDSDHRTPGKRTWYDSWWRTIPTRIVSYVGLYVGAAGCGSSLLRTYAALTGKKLTNLYEYHFFERK
ncbi:MAG: lanthionine synthetase LanC family protein [Lachnospiraceae bacterium]|nr:lanthionine synthetase LanC family protein [Lachnospiraceae bacterium]